MAGPANPSGPSKALKEGGQGTIVVKGSGLRRGAKWQKGGGNTGTEKLVKKK